MSDNQKSENSRTKQSKGKSILQFLKYFCFSASAGIIQTVSFTLLNEVVLKTDFIRNAINSNETFAKIMQNEYGPIYLIALVLSVLWNFTFNRKFTFKSAANIPVAMAKVFGYYCVFTPLSILWGNFFTSRFSTVPGIEYFVLAFTMAINCATEFLFYKFFVFKGREGTAKTKDKTE